MEKRNVYLALVSETDRPHEGLELVEVPKQRGWLFLGFNDKKRSGGRRGVGIVLSPRAHKDWLAAGGGTIFESSRNLAIRLENGTSSIVAVASYFPHSGYADSIVEAHYEEINVIMSRRREGEGVIIGADVNADVGRQRRRVDNPKAEAVGPYGLRVWNERGDRLVDWALQNGLLLARTFFKKRRSSMLTWRCFGKEKHAHSIDQFLVSKNIFHRVRDAGRAGSYVDSDHLPIKLWLRRPLVLAPKKPALVLRKTPRRLDYTALQGDSEESVLLRKQFHDKFKAVLSELQSQSTSASTEVGPGCDPVPCSSSSYEVFAMALLETVTEIVPAAERRRPGWWAEYSDRILEVASDRNELLARALSMSPKDPQYESTRRLLRGARKAVAKAVNTAKEAWVILRCQDLAGDSDRRGGCGRFWVAAKELMAGLEKPSQPRSTQYKLADGTCAATDKENLDVLEEHYKRVYNRPSSFDPKVTDLLPQRELITALDEFPSDLKIRSALSALKSGKSSGDGLPSDAFKLAAASDFGFEETKRFLRDFWESGLAPDAWVTLKLAVLPKKGDRHDVNNTRGIALMQAIPKLAGIIIGNMLNEHLIVPENSAEYGYQCGFIPKRGCPDGQMPVKLALQKRQHCGLDTYVLFVDLVKAFDSVDRVALDKILEKFGVPPKLRRVIMALHSNVKIELNFGNESSHIPNTMGVVQGGTLSPTLFIIFVHAFVCTLDTSKWVSPAYESVDDDGVFRPLKTLQSKGRSKHIWSAEEFARMKTLTPARFKLPSSFYADDSAFLFVCRHDLEVGVATIDAHFARWGLEMHVGRGGKTSKTVALFCPGHGRNYGDGDTSPITVRGVCHVSFVKSFKYLGSLIHFSLSDDTDVKERIAAASSLFGSLRDCIFSDKKISLLAKRHVYSAMVVPTLIYGSELWAISDSTMNKLRTFHHRCVRAMCRVNLRTTRENSITTAALLERIGLRSIETLILRRSMGWLGHVARMDFDRLPRRFLTAWVQQPRSSQLQLHYGAHITKCLRKLNLDQTWYSLAQDRANWRAMIEGINLEVEKKKKKPPATNAHASARSLRDSTNIIIPTNHRVQR